MRPFTRYSLGAAGQLLVDGVPDEDLSRDIPAVLVKRRDVAIILFENLDFVDPGFAWIDVGDEPGRGALFVRYSGNVRVDEVQRVLRDRLPVWIYAHVEQEREGSAIGR